MTKPHYAIIGDTHGDMIWLLSILDDCRRLGVRTMFQLGDWGFLWSGKHGDAVTHLGDALAKRGQEMYFIDGNHDFHPALRARQAWPANVHYCRRGTTRAFPNADGRLVSVGFLGGAPSIDKGQRLEGVDWWPEEEVVPEELGTQIVDVLMTHDAPALPPEFTGLPLDSVLEARCAAHRELIKQAVRTALPRRLFHGHYHYAYEASFEGIEVIGLDCNRKPGGYILVDHNFETPR